MDKFKITVYSGMDVLERCGEVMHPAQEVNMAIEMLEEKIDDEAWTNSPEFVAAINNLHQYYNVEVEYILNGVSHGNNAEPIFADFNRAYEIISEKLKTFAVEPNDGAMAD
jgi:hypothetical protein